MHNPARITQSELSRVLAIFNDALQLADGIQRRLHAGATVEAGELEVENLLAYPAQDKAHTEMVELGGIDIRPAKKEPAPKWVTETPPVGYELHMYCDAVVQELALNAAEYAACKREVARMRGFEVPEVVNA